MYKGLSQAKRSTRSVFCREYSFQFSKTKTNLLSNDLVETPFCFCNRAGTIHQYAYNNEVRRKQKFT
jgi:hypothetical protein